ncbi:hypothetical protein FCL47_15205 [Desulfopila sp. IMCC35006]|uniref:oligosaccharide flippase family protein n=1 Tax=Desulfopila sp. IMCC35006 TaxID=2569542 RepID=UPI0010ACE54F|nr:oligosaccharide flippase family protein [Desulfopila sp. IMCC35006]TKB24996.1 hypothetical protein FCL47_15205 [Desulfopila sp. IMCC35006]
MDLRRKLFRGVAVLGLSQVVSQGCSVVRNILIARIVSPADFGISAIFVMVVSFIQMMTNFSPGVLLVQAADGNEPRFQQTAQFVLFLRGMLGATVIVISAPFLSYLFNIPDATGAFYALALVPLFNGFCHMDQKRIERNMRFGPGASIEMGTQLIVLLLAWPIGKWYGDYRAMLALLLIKQFLSMVGTQLVAERKYRWNRDTQNLKRFWSFGAPLLVNGLLMFGILQGDRFIMGAAKKLFGSGYDMTHVGYYSAAFMLVMSPVMMVGKISSSLALPVLSKLQGSQTVFEEKASFYNEVMALLASVFGGIFIISGDKLLLLVYGETYRPAAVLMVWLTVLWAIRLLRMVPANITIAMGQTKTLMYTNIIRFLSIAGIVPVVVHEMDFVWVAIVGALGEAAAYLINLLLNKLHVGIPFSWSLRPMSLFVISLVAANMFRMALFQINCNASWLVIGLALLLFNLLLLFLFRSVILRELKYLKQFSNKLKFLK